MVLEKIGTNGRTYKYKDLTNLKVGSYTIMYRTANKVRGPKNRATVWVANCDCGNTRELEYANIMWAKKKIEEGTVSIFSCGCKSSLPFGVSACKAVFRQYKVHAENRGYEFAIEWDDFVSITKSNCHYCGAAPKNKIGRTEKKRGNGHYVYNGIDRMDNKKGYYLDNVVPCCRVCNRAKDVMGAYDFLLWVSRVYNHAILRN
jgi:hypothetical protein